MKKAVLLFLSILGIAFSHAQNSQITALQVQLKQHIQADTFRVNRLNELGSMASLTSGTTDSLATEALAISRKINYDKGQAYALINLAKVRADKGEKARSADMLQQAYSLAQKVNDRLLLAKVYLGMGDMNTKASTNKEALAYYLKAEDILQRLGDKRSLALCERKISSMYENSFSDYPKSMQWAIKSTKSAEEANCQDCLLLSYASMGNLYMSIGDNEKSLIYDKKALAINKNIGDKEIESNLLNSVGERYRLMKNYPEAIKSYKAALAISNTTYKIELEESNLAYVYAGLNNFDLANKYGIYSLGMAKKIDDTEGIAWIDYILGLNCLKQGMTDSALYYGNNGLAAAKQTGTLEFIRDNFNLLADAYVKIKDFENAYKYQNLYIIYRDSMVNSQITNQTTLLQYNYDLAKKQSQITELNQDKKLQNYFLLGALIVLGLIAITVVILLRNNRQKQKANNLLSRQKEIIEEQRDQTNKALSDLQLTQKQLIQSEKMASLGELTAGIAHEIQNPLNFINNFSEVNVELIAEMKEELKNGQLEDAEDIAGDIEQNLLKVIHHGKRADGIVKGMLQHSRTGSTTKELTDINNLADEYLRLAYHGLRAKDKSFNAELLTDYAKNLPKANVLPQEIGRVLLNLYTNAFYAVQQRQQKSHDSYSPAVEVITSSNKNHIIIKVRDNGIGIPEYVKEKIMQPFFTTKPTGEGTGLGLSLSYDIIVKGHGGEINVDTKENDHTVFTITLPL